MNDTAPAVASFDRAADPDWWRGAVIYQIYPRSFQDTDGDGIGDLAGITARLPYVAGLGVDAVWISPFFTSPMKDFGYDVADYCDVDPIFGTLADFRALVGEAHRLGLKVMIDLVLSHSSDRHPWFVESRRDRTNPKADWYVWAEAKPDGTPPNNWLSVFGGSAWEWDSGRCQYYLHNFLASQPDLNYHNPEVQDAALDIFRFWLELGVDGFRLDAVNFIVHDRLLRDNPARTSVHVSADTPAVNPYGRQVHLYDKTQPENLDFLKRIRALLDRHPGTATIGEVGDNENSLATIAAYTAGGDKLNMCYSFHMLGDAYGAGFFRATVEETEAASPDGWPCWALSNHDAKRVASRFRRHAGDPVRQAKLMLAMLTALRGSVCLYQGEELGLTEADIAFEDLVDPYGIRFWPEFKGRDGCRTPMPWTAAAPAAGFSAGKPWLPVPAEHHALAVDRQEADPASVLATARRFLAFRRAHPALVKGDIAFLPAEGEVLAFLRRHGNEAVVCVFNLGHGPVRWSLPGDLSVEPLSGHDFTGVLAGGAVDLAGEDAFFARVT